MNLQTLLSYLCGARDAILDVAGCRQAIWLGMLFVLAAGFAREYDGEDLWHEPWHLCLPLCASLLSSFLLFGLVWGISRQRGGQAAPFWKDYRTFLGLYWLTAPLALLYAIPVERLLTAHHAVTANLWLLAIVSVWRVALMARVISVLYRCRAWAAFFVVMLFADAVAMAVFWLTPLPIVSIMGGIRLTESERVIQATGMLVRFFGTVSLPVWLIGVCVIAASKRSDNSTWRLVAQHAEPRRPVSRGLWCIAGAVLVGWLFVLPATQPEQTRRRYVETALRQDRIAEALDYMSALERDDFPPHWDPPPRIGYGETTPDIVDVLLQLQRPGAADWVRELFREKLALQSRGHGYGGERQAVSLGDMDDERLARYAALLAELPQGPAMARYHENEIQMMLDPGFSDSQTDRLSESRHDTLRAILRLGRDEQAPIPDEVAPGDA